MNIQKAYMLDEINIVYGKRNLSYFKTGYTYWYNGREVSNKPYSELKWKKIKQRFNHGYGVMFERNKEFNFGLAVEADKLIQKAVLEDMEKKNV